MSHTELSKSMPKIEADYSCVCAVYYVYDVCVWCVLVVLYVCASK